jgi:signal transduction histidine kinase
MIALINDLLDFARAGKVEFASEPISINRILDDVQRDMTFYVKERNATVVVSPNLPAVKCDPIRFSQIWKNLLSNAIKYNDNPHPRVEVSCESSQPHVHQFNVKDNGIGLNEKDFEMIFQPFKRAATTGKYEGTGIGLAIVKRVVDFHGGRIWVSSKVGEGTTFHFTLPKVLDHRVA